MKYYQGFLKALGSIKPFEIAKAAEALKAASTVFVGGNGGSAAIANHLTCDFQKGAGLKVHSLSCNTPLITAIANDCGYHFTLSHQIYDQRATPKDIVILVSSSGNSPNIIEAAALCKRYKIPLIGLTGFSGGKLKKMADISIHIKSEQYGHIEDAHSHVMHTLANILKGP